MVSLYFGHVSLHSSALPIPVNQTPKLTEILCLQMLCLPCAFSYPIPVFFLSLRFKNHASQMSPCRITSVTGRCRRELCVVCPAPAATSSTSPELLHRQKHPPNQTSRLLTVFRRLRSPSLLPAPTATASASSTQQMNLRSTRVHKRGRTLLFLLMLCIA